jgi:hypothetical protein
MDDFDYLSDEELERIANGERITRNVRNNNPGNIEDGAFTRAQPGYLKSDGRFAIFATPEDGFRAQQNLLRTRYAGETLSQVISKYAPPSENNTQEYINFVARQTGLRPDDVVTDDHWTQVAHAMNRHEGGVEYNIDNVDKPAAPKPEATPEPSQNMNFAFGDVKQINDAQQATYRRLMQDRKFDGKAEGGSELNPFGIQHADQIAMVGPGKYYVDIDGSVNQRPQDLEYDQKLGLWRGASRVLDNAAVGVEAGLNLLGRPFGNGQWVDDIEHAMGANTAKEARAERDQAFADKEREGVVAGGVGRFVGETLPLMAIPALRGAGLMGAVGTGAVSGALTSDANTAGGVAADAGLGAIGGTIIRGAASLPGKLLKPRVAPNLARLIENGVQTSPAQSLGGKIAAFGGGAIGRNLPGAAAATNRSAASFGPSAVNEVLRPFGAVVPKGSTVEAALGHADEVLDRAASQATTPAAMQAVENAAARLAIIGKAGEGSWAKAGAFNPAQLNAAVSANPIGGRADKVLSDYATMGRDVLGAGERQSPLAGRIAGALGIGGGAGASSIAALGVPLAAHALPAGAALSGASMAANSKLGAAAIRSMAAGNRSFVPEAVGNAAERIRSLPSGPMGVMGGEMGSGSFGGPQAPEAVPERAFQAPQQAAPVDDKWTDPHPELSDAELEAISKGR